MKHNGFNQVQTNFCEGVQAGTGWSTRKRWRRRGFSSRGHLIYFGFKKLSQILSRDCCLGKYFSSAHNDINRASKVMGGVSLRVHRKDSRLRRRSFLSSSVTFFHFPLAEMRMDDEFRCWCIIRTTTKQPLSK